MSDFVVARTRIFAGIWEGVVQAVSKDNAAEPSLEVTHLGEAIRSFSVEADPARAGQWFLRIALPPERINDGVQSFLINDSETGETLSSFSVAVGETLDADLYAEVELLRAELDMLKRAFRRHCLEG